MPTLKKSAFKMPGYRCVSKDVEVNIKHSLDEENFEEIKERDSEDEDANSAKLDIVSESESSD
jgi:hypothetical protein